MKKQLKEKFYFYPDKEYIYFESMSKDYDAIQKLKKSNKNATIQILSIERDDLFMVIDRKIEISQDEINEQIKNIQKYIPDYEIIIKGGKFHKGSPSKTTSENWLIANKKGKFFESTKKSGKWLVFLPKNEIDSVWKQIETATETGLLGDCSKVSTSKDSPYSPDKNKGVICVYTNDYTDKDDVMRIREELRKLGITQKIPYKTDKNTSAGKYGVNGDTDISEYYE